MRFEDVKLGMRVVPHSKSVGVTPLRCSPLWKKCLNDCQGFLYVVDIENDGIIVCNFQIDSDSGDYFLASDLIPYEERYTCNIPDVTVELVPGKEYWVSDYSVREAVCDPIRGKYICTIKGRHYMEMDEHNVCGWKYAVDPDIYKEPETEMTVEEIAEALRKSGAIKGKLKIKE